MYQFCVEGEGLAAHWALKTQNFYNLVELRSIAGDCKPEFISVKTYTYSLTGEEIINLQCLIFFDLAGCTRKNNDFVCF